MTNWHPTEDELVEHLGGESQPHDRLQIEAHLVACDECRRTAEEIAGALTMVETAVPEPPAGFERVMWARVQRAIDAGTRQPWYASFGWRQWLPAAALAAVAIAGISLSMRPEPAPPVMQAAADEPISISDDELKKRVLYTALDDHLQQAEMLLVEVRNASAGDSLAFESSTADELISAGRLYRQTAEYTGEQRVVQVLDDLEPVLVEVARSPERMPSDTRQWLRTRIDDDALLFKVRVAASDARERMSNPN